MASLAFGTAARAQSIFINCDQWVQLPTSLREIYVAGVIDALSTITVPEGARTAKHYNDCIVSSRMSLSRIAEGTKKFMETHSDLRYKPASNVVQSYLITLCGLPRPSEGALLEGSVGFAAQISE